MSRSIGSAGLALIKEFEGCRLTAYRCSAGVWTVGYGHTAGVTEETAITQEQAESWLKEDCQKFANYVDNPVYVPITSHLNANQRDALISFSYNCGAGNLKKLCASRNQKEIAEAMLLYNKAAGKALAGLIRRRAAEKKLFLTPCEEQKERNPYAQPVRVIWYRKGNLMCGVDVKWMQRELQQSGYQISIDGKCGPATDKSLREFQKNHSLVVDGKCGPATISVLKENIKDL